MAYIFVAIATGIIFGAFAWQTIKNASDIKMMKEDAKHANNR